MDLVATSLNILIMTHQHSYQKRPGNSVNPDNDISGSKIVRNSEILCTDLISPGIPRNPEAPPVKASVNELIDSTKIINTDTPAPKFNVVDFH